MKYINAKDVLPPELFNEVQKYAGGSILYIPKSDEQKLQWGQLTGTKERVSKRNITIAVSYKNGASISDLIDEFCLSEDSIKKIIYNKDYIV